MYTQKLEFGRFERFQSQNEGLDGGYLLVTSFWLVLYCYTKVIVDNRFCLCAADFGCGCVVYYY